MRTLIWYWLPVFCYCLLIFIQSAFPMPDLPPRFPFSDKLLHFLAYTLLGALFCRAFGTLKLRHNRLLWLGASILATTLYGLSDEMHQSFVPSRSAELLDFIADGLGGSAGVLVYWRLIGQKSG